MRMTDHNEAIILQAGQAQGAILACDVGLSFWGGVDPETGLIIDAFHPHYQQSITGKILMMPSSRGSCSGSGVFLSLCLNGKAPAALIFCEDEEILTLGAFVASRLFDKTCPVIRLDRHSFDKLASNDRATIDDATISAQTITLRCESLKFEQIELGQEEQSWLEGRSGHAQKIAMEILRLMCAANGTDHLIDISKGHIDGSIYCHEANLIFAEKMKEIGAQLRVPTTINAISVDRELWPLQSVAPDFADKAVALADAYVSMGAAPVFTCAPYLLESAPEAGENIGWSESNAVIFANSILGARTLKHPDYLDLFIAMTGKAPASGVYLDDQRKAQMTIALCLPENTLADDLIWPLMGWLTGTIAPSHIPFVTGLESVPATQDDLKAFCAAFGTTSGAPLVHIKGHSAEAHLPQITDQLSSQASQKVSLHDLKGAWHRLNHNFLKNQGSVDLVAIGSPHASFEEVAEIHRLLSMRYIHNDITMMVTVGRPTLAKLKKTGLFESLTHSGLSIIADLCWCSITEPVFPASAATIMTNSAKYAHYAYGLSGRPARLASLQECVETAISGKTPVDMPNWLRTGS